MHVFCSCEHYNTMLYGFESIWVITCCSDKIFFSLLAWLIYLTGSVARLQAGGLAALPHAVHVRFYFLRGHLRRLLRLPVSHISQPIVVTAHDLALLLGHYSFYVFLFFIFVIYIFLRYIPERRNTSPFFSVHLRRPPNSPRLSPTYGCYCSVQPAPPPRGHPTMGRGERDITTVGVVSC